MYIKVFVTLLLSLVLNPVKSLQMSMTFNGITDNLSLGSIRLFHPFFPAELTQCLSVEDAEKILNVKRVTGSSENVAIARDDLIKRGIPWRPLPEIGISDAQNIMSKKQISEAFENYCQYGHIVWGHKLSKIQSGCVLLNHWKQEVVVITDYSPAKGARGYKLLHPKLSDKKEEIIWPPITLELELREKKWQAASVSENILSGEILSLLPLSMNKAVWELIFLLLLPKEEKVATQTLFDTGLSPRQGLIAYVRLLRQVELRTEAWDEVPGYRLIKEFDVSV